jgi:lipid-binding SYLF domain-containing protein
MRIIVLILASFLALPASGEWEPDAGDELQVASRETIQRFRDLEGESFDTLFADAHAFAVFPDLKRTSLLVGWASGHGVLVEQDQFTGHVRQRRFSLGFQMGRQTQGQILLFRDEQAVREFKEGRINFTPQASMHASKPRKAADTSFSPRVAVLSISEKGLSIEAAIGGSKYRFRPSTPSETASAD